MSYLHAILLGLIQGITEFLPVSSSAHLQLAKLALGLSEVPLVFDLACHLGTLCALVIFLRKEIYDLLTSNRIKIVYLFLALIPLVPSLLVLGPLRKWVQSPSFLGLFLMGTSLILFLGQTLKIKKKRGLFHDALWIGTAQTAALFPGISRSASTISCAHILGWTLPEAIRFSFLLSIPTVLGGNVLEVHHLLKTGQLSLLLNPFCLIGFCVSFGMGLLVVRHAIAFLERGKWSVLAWYCLLLGLSVNLILLWPR